MKPRTAIDDELPIIRRIRAVVILGPEVSPAVKEYVEQLFDEFVREKIMPLFSEVDWHIIG